MASPVINDERHVVVVYPHGLVECYALHTWTRTRFTELAQCVIGGSFINVPLVVTNTTDHIPLTAFMAENFHDRALPPNLDVAKLIAKCGMAPIDEINVFHGPVALCGLQAPVCEPTGSSDEEEEDIDDPEPIGLSYEVTKKLISFCKKH